MKRFICFLFITLALVVCSCKNSAPTDSPAPTLANSPMPKPQATLTPQHSPTPRITIVPSATRLQSESPDEVQGDSTLPTNTVASSSTSIPSSTPTPRIIDAGATATSTRPPTSTPPDSPLPTPTLQESPPTPPSGTLTTTTTPTLSPTSSAADATATPTVSGEATPTSTATPTPTLPDEGWSFEKVYAYYYDDGSQEFYISGEAVNNTGSNQRLTSLMPVVYDEDQIPVTSERDVEFPEDYDELREAVSLAPGQSLPFDLLVYLPEDVSVENNYEILVQAEPAEAPRDDLDITSYTDDDADWPDYFYVDGTFENPGPDLTKYVAIIVTLYDEDGRVIGVGWSYETSSSALAAGEHEFRVEVATSDMVYDLKLEVYSYKVHSFGY